jgi:Tol biopolymer transport system component
MAHRSFRIASSLLGVLVGAPLFAQVTQRASVDSAGVQANDESFDPTISADGRFVVFSSRASNLVPGDTNNAWDVFVRDRWTGATERASVSTGGAQGDADSGGLNAPLLAITPDGRYVAFNSDATNLVTIDQNSIRDIFIRDRQNGTTTRLIQGSGWPDKNYVTPSISDDGRYVAFESDSSLIVGSDSNMVGDVFVMDRQTFSVQIVSRATDGTQGFFVSGNPRISATVATSCSRATPTTSIRTTRTASRTSSCATSRPVRRRSRAWARAA